YAIYLLTRQGNVTTNDLASLQKRLGETQSKDWKNDLTAAWIAASYKLLKQDKLAGQMLAGPLKLLSESGDREPWSYHYYYDPLTRDAVTLYLVAKHFPDQLKSLPPQALENIVRPLQQGRFNTYSSSMTILALDAYATQAPGDVNLLTIGAVKADGSVASIGKVDGMLQSGTWTPATARLRLTNGSTLPAWYVVSQSGYDRDTPSKAQRDGVEITRDYTDTNGKPIDKVTIGDEIDVHVKVRSTTSRYVDNLAIVDLLPGGFDPVIQPPPPVTDPQAAGDSSDSDSDQGGDSKVDASAWRSPIGVGQPSWHLQYADVREDRVVLYGTATPEVGEFVYRIKATNAGKFIVPPAFGESLYDRKIQARAPGGATITVVRKP
ncbi:MAG TPA: alpha-2-macroglobulin family protein, partial [Dyella sp.]